MGRKKPQIGVTDWHQRILQEVLESPAFAALPGDAVKLYLTFLAQLRSTNNGNLSATLTKLRHCGWTSPVTLAQSLRQLRAAGLIALTRGEEGDRRRVNNYCNLYRLTDRESYAFPKLHIEGSKATHDYRRHKTFADAKKAIKAASPSKQRKKNFSDTESVA